MASSTRRPGSSTTKAGRWPSSSPTAKGKGDADLFGKGPRPLFPLASLPAVRVVPFPRFHGTIKALRRPAALLAVLRCLRLAIPRGASWNSLPPPKSATAVDREYFGFGDPPNDR